MKKAQTEIMGMVVIIILIAVGLLFFIAFVVLKPKSELGEKTTVSVLASSTLNSLQHITTDCRGMNVQDLLLDCASRKAIVCGTENSCFFVNHTVADILNRTLSVQDKRFAFSAYIEDGDKIPLESIGINSGCLRNMERESQSQPLRTVYGSTLVLNLDICR